MIARPGFSLPFTTVFGTGGFNEIPPMLDPLGKHWHQPSNMREVLMDDTHVGLTSDQLRELPEYSSSYPSGTYFGKCWKRTNDEWPWLCWYKPHVNPEMISIGSRLIVEVAP